jgi:soluble lytic murein transglycosylase
VTLKFVLAAALVLGAGAPALASSDVKSSADVKSDAKVPAQLGPNAKAMYKDIFAAIKSSQWADAQAKLAAMPEGPLHNVAWAELYLAKGSPKVDGAALAALAEKAPHLPQARQLAALAEGRGASASINLPMQQELYWLGTAPRRGKVAGSDMRGLPLAGRIAPLIKNDQPNEAEAVLDANLGSLNDETLTEWRHRIAWTYYLTGDDPAARRLAAVAAKGSGDFAAQAEWVAGLAAWRQKDFAAASASFDAAARRLTDSEMVAAAQFWGARADMSAGKPERVDAKLKAASRNPETFYGLLALNRLGLKAKPAEYPNLTNVESLPNVRAALALEEIGEDDLADQLIRHQARIGRPQDHATLANIAGRMSMPGTQLWLSQNGPSGAQASVSARYPAPKDWKPTGGWRVDKSLVYAHALQESRFRVNATSPVGARGLMQVRPGTANDIARARGESGAGPLGNPTVNLEYGQSYIESIRDRWETGGMLPKVIAAYNAGPKPVGEWNAQTRDSGDPLLYIESIPYWETRAYVATVMRNYWMYQLQAGEKMNSLTALSQGMWPRFPGMPGPMAVRLDRSGGVQSAE